MTDEKDPPESEGQAADTGLTIGIGQSTTTGTEPGQ